MQFRFVPVLLRVLIANGIFPALQKYVTGLHSRPKRFVMQFFFSLLLAIITFLIFSKLSISDSINWLIVGMGFASAIATYYHWKAVDISLSRNAILTVWDDIIAIGLGLIILKEYKFFNLNVGFGLFLCLLAVILFLISDSGKRNTGVRKYKFYGYIIFYSIIWGVTDFLMKYWATENVPAISFIFNWYIGTFIGSLGIFLWISYFKKDKGIQNAPLQKRDIFIVFLLGACIFGALILTYWSYALAPLIVVQPIFLIAEMTLPAIVGLMLFKEGKQFNKLGWAGFGLGIIGGIILVFSL